MGRALVCVRAVTAVLQLVYDAAALSVPICYTTIRVVVMVVVVIAPAAGAAVVRVGVRARIARLVRRGLVKLPRFVVDTTYCP